MCKIIATIISILFFVMLDLCYIWDYDFFYNLKKAVLSNLGSVCLWGDLLSKGILAILYCRHSNIIKVWLRENCSTEYKYKNSQIYTTFLIFSAFFFYYLASLVVYHSLFIGVELCLLDDDTAFSYLIVFVAGLLCYIIRCYKKNKLHHCSILLTLLLLGFSIPYILFPNTHTFNIELLFVFRGSDEMARKLVGNLFITLYDFWLSEPFLFASVFWYEGLWIVYLRSLRFDEEFPKITKFFIFLVLLGVTVNIFVIFYFIHPATPLINPKSILYIYWLWFVVAFNIVLLLR